MDIGLGQEKRIQIALVPSGNVFIRRLKVGNGFLIQYDKNVNIRLSMYVFICYHASIDNQGDDMILKYAVCLRFELLNGFMKKQLIFTHDSLPIR